MISQHSLIGLVGAVGLLFQVIAGGMAISDKIRDNSRDFVATKKRASQVAALLACSLVIGGGFLVYWFVAPDAIASEKPTPCISTQTGDATTNGSQSPANTGSGNPTTYGVPAETPKPQPKRKE